MFKVNHADTRTTPDIVASNFIKNDTLIQVFSFEFGEISKNTFFISNNCDDCFRQNVPKISAKQTFVSLTATYYGTFNYMENVFSF